MSSEFDKEESINELVRQVSNLVSRIISPNFCQNYLTPNYSCLSSASCISSLALFRLTKSEGTSNSEILTVGFSPYL